MTTVKKRNSKNLQKNGKKFEKCRNHFRAKKIVGNICHPLSLPSLNCKDFSQVNKGTLCCALRNKTKTDPFWGVKQHLPPPSKRSVSNVFKMWKRALFKKHSGLTLKLGRRLFFQIYIKSLASCDLLIQRTIFFTIL